MRNSMSVMRSVALTIMALALVLGGAGRARAEFTITFAQDGANVDATGTGTINLTALNAGPLLVAITPPAMQPNNGLLLLGFSPTKQYQIYYNGISGPNEFGTGGLAFVSSATGLGVGLLPISEISVPVGYVSGDTISSGATWDNATISGLGLTPGTYAWTWGSGPTADSLEVIIPAASAAPEPCALALLGVGAGGLLGYAGLRRKRARKAACAA